jgi:hypothetical protein
MRTSDAVAAADVVAAAYDLTRRGAIGDVTYFEHIDDYFVLDQAGGVANQDRIRGFIREDVLGVRPDGGLELRWTRSGTTSTSYEQGIATAQPTVLTCGAGLRLEACFEDDFDIIPVPADSLPHDMSGFHMLEHVIHSSLAATFTSRRHGHIDKLRHVGDTVVMGISGRTPGLDFGGFISIRMERGTSTATFEGVGRVGDRPAAIVSFDCPQTFPFVNGGGGRGDVTGRVWLDLDGGQVLRGEFQQTNYFALPMGPDGSDVALNQIVRGSLRQVTASEYPA